MIRIETTQNFSAKPSSEYCRNKLPLADFVEQLKFIYVKDKAPILQIKLSIEDKSEIEILSKWFSTMASISHQTGENPYNILVSLKDNSLIFQGNLFCTLEHLKGRKVLNTDQLNAMFNNDNAKKIIEASKGWFVTFDNELKKENYALTQKSSPLLFCTHSNDTYLKTDTKINCNK